MRFFSIALLAGVSSAIKLRATGGAGGAGGAEPAEEDFDFKCTDLYEFGATDEEVDTCKVLTKDMKPEDFDHFKCEDLRAIGATDPEIKACETLHEEIKKAGDSGSDSDDDPCGDVSDAEGKKICKKRKL